MLKLYNTLTRSEEEFKPIEPGKAKMYCCGLTVYNYAHIGNLRAYYFEDILRRVLAYNGYEVTHVQNITDVGHLTSDEDEGEDKMITGAAREGKTVWELAEYYTEEFKKDLAGMNILYPDIWCKATDYIKEQIEMIQCLEAKGYAYVTADGVYYDTSKFPDYGELARLDIKGLQEGIRVDAGEKKNKTDFALWKFSPKNEKRQMEWESPWGKGFPGWHIECSAMARKFLGDTFDIHCGGIDHIPVHHTNEIAQSEACTGKKLANYWMHCEFLLFGEVKMSKSSGEFLRLKTLTEMGYSPMHYRYFLMQASYRQKQNFSFEGLDSAKAGYNNLKSKIAELKFKIDGDGKGAVPNPKNEEYRQTFLKNVNDNLNVTRGISVIWELLRDNELSDSDKILLIKDFDNVLGLRLLEIDEKEEAEIPSEVVEIAEQRLKAKAEKNYKLSDELRAKVKEMGFEILDKKDGYDIKRIS